MEAALGLMLHGMAIRRSVLVPMDHTLSAVGATRKPVPPEFDLGHF